MLKQEAQRTGAPPSHLPFFVLPLPLPSALYLFLTGGIESMKLTIQIVLFTFLLTNST